MASATKVCRVCGGEYEYCHTNRRIAGIFRWQDVACCPQHGAEYLAKIRESRETDETVSENTDDELTTETTALDLEDEDEDFVYEDSSEEEDDEEVEF